MIIKLAITSDDYEHSLNKKEKAKYNAIKAGATFGGTTLAGKYLTTMKKEIKPGTGRVKRFLIEKNIIPGLKDTVMKRHLTPGKAAQMGAIGVLGGGILGLGIHEAHRKIKEFKKRLK
jgi:hypothetical protein